MSLLPRHWTGPFQVSHEGRRTDPAPRLDERDEFPGDAPDGGDGPSCGSCGALIYPGADFCPFCDEEVP